MAPYATRAATQALEDFKANAKALVEAFIELEKRSGVIMDSDTATKLIEAIENTMTELKFRIEDYVNLESEEEVEEVEPEQPPKKTRKAPRVSKAAANEEAKSEKSESSKKNLKRTRGGNVPSSPRKNRGPKRVRSLGDS